MSRQIAVVTSYADLHAALRARADELDRPRSVIDACAGFEDGYASKLLAPVPIKGIGPQTLGPLLTVLGLKIVLVEDAEALGRFAKRARSRKRHDAGSPMLAGKKRKRRGHRFGSEFAKVQRAKQLLTQSAQQRSRTARKASRARWKRAKQKRAATRCAPEAVRCLAS